MPTFNFQSKDKINSQLVIKVYFFIDEKRVETKTICMFSKWQKQNEAKQSFIYWREKLHSYRFPENSQFGMKCGEIYNNKNPNWEKKPILRIYADGTEKWYPQVITLQQAWS